MRRALAASAAVLLLAGCGFSGARDVPLPGGTGGDTYRVRVVFADASNLEPKETCRANDVVVGSVASVDLDKQLRAVVVCEIEKRVSLPGNAVATLRSTSLLGERFVAIEPPAGASATGRLAAGTTIRADDTTTDPDAEQVLSALSALLNGGDLAKIATINTELNDALGGNETQIRALLRNVADVTRRLADHTDDITTALDSLDRLGATVAGQRRLLGSAIDEIPGGLRVLERQRPKLVALLGRLQQLSRTAVPLIDRSQDDLVADLRSLRLVLGSLASTGKELAPALAFLSTYPFPRNALAAIKGDYAGFYASFNFDFDLISSLLSSALLPTATKAASTSAPSGASGSSGTATPPAPTTQPSTPITKLPGLPDVLGELLPQGGSVTTTPTLPGLVGLLTGNAP